MTNPSNSPSVDREWARTLVGLRMLVESSWWPSYDDSELNPGRIVDVNFDDPAGRFFLLELDDELGANYRMRYDAVLKYADESQRNFHTFHLPMALLPDPEDETITLAQLANLRQTSRPTSRPTILHNPTTDDYSAQDLSSDSGDESFGAPNNNDDDDDWSQPNEQPNDHDLLLEANVKFEDDDSSNSLQSNIPLQDHKTTIQQYSSVQTRTTGVGSVVLWLHVRLGQFRTSDQKICSLPTSRQQRLNH